VVVESEPAMAADTSGVRVHYTRETVDYMPVGAVPDVDYMSVAVPDVVDMSVAAPDVVDMSVAVPDVDDMSVAAPDVDDMSVAAPDVDDMSVYVVTVVVVVFESAVV